MYAETSLMSSLVLNKENEEGLGNSNYAEQVGEVES